MYTDVRLLFQNSASAESHSECEDAIYLYPFDSTAPVMINAISRYLESGKVEKSPLKDDQRDAVLTKSMNNQQLSYKVDRNVITIVLKSCTERNMIEQHGRGFRMLAYGSGMLLEITINILKKSKTAPRDLSSKFLFYGITNGS